MMFTDLIFFGCMSLSLFCMTVGNKTVNVKNLCCRLCWNDNDKAHIQPQCHHRFL